MTFLDSFVPQLLATLVGGAIGVFGVWLAFKWQRQASAKDGVEQAVENLLLRITDHISAGEAYQREWQMHNWARGDMPRRTPPSSAPVSIACELLRLRTTGAEREAADLIADAWDHLSYASGTKALALCSVFARHISAWRLGSSITELRSNLDTLNAAAVDPEDQE